VSGHARTAKSDMVCQEKNASSGSRAKLSSDRCHASVTDSIDTSTGLDMFAPTCPTPVATKFSPLKTPPSDKLPSPHADLPQPKALTYLSSVECPDAFFGSHAKLESGQPLIGVPAKAESINDPDVPTGGGHPGHSDQFFGNPASVEDLWEFAQEILHDDFSPNNAPLSMIRRAPRHLTSIPYSFRPLPLSMVGESFPGSYGGLEQRLVEGRHGVLHCYCPIWSKDKSNQRHECKTSYTKYEWVANYKCKCQECRYAFSVVRVDGGLVFMQKTELKNGKKQPVCHDMDRHNACPSPVRAGSRSSLSHAQKEYIAIHGLSKKKLDAFAGEMLHGDIVIASDEQRQDPSRFKQSVRDFIRRNPQYSLDRKRNPMKMDVVLELLDLLKTNPLGRDCNAPVGKSQNWYYYTEGWKHYVWKSLWVSSHDYSPELGCFTLFCCIHWMSCNALV